MQAVQVIDVTTDEGRKALRNLEGQPLIRERVDLVALQLGELFEINNPGKRLAEDFLDQQKRFIEQQIQDAGNISVWVYMPWNGLLTRILKEDDYLKLRTNRNQNLITHEEQQRLYNSTVAICGLSVGNSIALGLAQSGIAKNMVLADFDKIETANLNRLRAGLHQIGKSKLEVASQQICELNPFAQIKSFDQGINEDNLDTFFSNPRPEVIFDEIDDFKMKILLRLKARELGIPVVMLTSLGDNILLDIDRYDLDNSTPLFNGLIGDTPEEILKSEIGEKEKVKYAIKLVGVEYIPTKALESLLQINKTLVGRPQLGGTIMIDGGLATYIVRRLLLESSSAKIKGRYYLSLDKLTQKTATNESVESRTKILREVESILG